jgi:hypothetical protein
MLAKKLLTLGFAVGILACGACGIFYREPLAPVLRPVAGIRAILVEVTNVLPSHELAPTDIAEGIAKRLNVFSSGLQIFTTDNAKKQMGFLQSRFLRNQEESHTPTFDRTL